MQCDGGAPATGSRDRGGPAIRLAWSLAYGRDPETEELIEARKVVLEQGLSMLCRVVMNSNEFLFMP